MWQFFPTINYSSSDEISCAGDIISLLAYNSHIHIWQEKYTYKNVVIIWRLTPNCYQMSHRKTTRRLSSALRNSKAPLKRMLSSFQTLCSSLSSISWKYYNKSSLSFSNRESHIKFYRWYAIFFCSRTLITISCVFALYFANIWLKISARFVIYEHCDINLLMHWAFILLLLYSVTYLNASTFMDIHRARVTHSGTDFCGGSKIYSQGGPLVKSVWNVILNLCNRMLDNDSIFKNRVKTFINNECI